ncbi:unnamed protein product, partial [Nippostrongylus brasiliensis]|uniref:MFS domain-containing protein n=1 Tax=Nippostrongylus brasiliensis TaxID=27835 RepID=A0A0N4YAN6_NIPBR
MYCIQPAVFRTFSRSCTLYVETMSNLARRVVSCSEYVPVPHQTGHGKFVGRKPEKLQPPDPDESERLVSLESDGSETRLGASKEKGAGKGGGFVFGYQLLITNPAQAAFIEFVDHSYNKTHGESKDAKTIEFIWGIIVSSFFWGATIGSLLIQTVSDRLGRKIGILVMFIIQNVACALEILSH